MTNINVVSCMRPNVPNGKAAEMLYPAGMERKEDYQFMPSRVLIALIFEKLQGATHS